jgi:predicted GNAT family acetyltransferase
MIRPNGNICGMEVRKNTELSRYELVDDGEISAICDYVEQGDVVILPHTETKPHLRGRGLAAKVVRGALEDIAETGRHVIPSCWYVAEFIEAHSEYARIVAA